MQLVFQFAAIDGIAKIMSGSIIHEGDQIRAWSVMLRGDHLVQDVTKGLNEFDVWYFAFPADIVGFPGPTVLQDRPDSTAVVPYKEPVPDIDSLAVDRQWLTGQGIQNHEGDQFFRELIRAIIVGAV